MWVGLARGVTGLCLFVRCKEVGVLKLDGRGVAVLWGTPPYLLLSSSFRGRDKTCTTDFVFRHYLCQTFLTEK